MSTARWRGLVALVRDATVHGSHAVEQIQHATMRRTCAILEAVPSLPTSVRLVEGIHAVTVTGVHAAVRGVARLAGHVLDRALGPTSPTES